MVVTFVLFHNPRPEEDPAGNMPPLPICRSARFPDGLHALSTSEKTLCDCGTAERNAAIGPDSSLFSSL